MRTGQLRADFLIDNPGQINLDFLQNIPESDRLKLNFFFGSYNLTGTQRPNWNTFFSSVSVPVRER